MVLLDLLHVQRAGFFKFLKFGIDKELSQLNINVENTRLQVIPFFADRSKLSTYNVIDAENFSIKEASDLRELLQENLKNTQPKVIGGEPVRTSKKSPHDFSTQFLDYATLVEGIVWRSCLRPTRWNRARWHTLLAEQISKPLHLGVSSESRTSRFATYGRAELEVSKSAFKNLSDNVAPNKNSCFRLIAPKYTPREAILYQKSWSCKLVIKVLLTVHEKNKNQKFHKSKIYRNSKALAVLAVLATHSKHSKHSKHLKGHTKLGLNQGFKVTKNNLPFFKTTHNLAQSTTNLRLASKGCLTNRRFVRPSCGLFNLPVNLVDSKNSFTAEGSGKQDLKKNKGLPTPNFLQSTRSTQSTSVATSTSVPLSTQSTSVARSSPFLTSNSALAKQGVGTVVKHELFLVLGELPLMTKRGHFIIHGSPRVILSQLIRKPGIYFTQKNNELQADCIPEQGPWLCIYKDLNDESAGVVKLPAAKVAKKLNSKENEILWDPVKKVSKGENKTSSHLDDDSKGLIGILAERSTQGTSMPLKEEISAAEPSHTTTSFGPEARYHVSEDGQEIKNSLGTSSVLGDSTPTYNQAELEVSKGVNDLRNSKFAEASYFCYTKQFSSMPFSLVYSTFRVFELHSQFTDQTLLLTKLKTLEKIHKFKDLITTLLTFTWKKRIRKRLQRLYTKRCFISTQQFEKTKVLFRLKKKLILGPNSRKSFNEKLGITSCVETGLSQNIFDTDFFGNRGEFVSSNKSSIFPSKVKESEARTKPPLSFNGSLIHLPPKATDIQLEQGSFNFAHAQHNTFQGSHQVSLNSSLIELKLTSAEGNLWSNLYTPSTSLLSTPVTLKRYVAKVDYSMWNVLLGTHSKDNKTTMPNFYGKHAEKKATNLGGKTSRLTLFRKLRQNLILKPVPRALRPVLYSMEDSRVVAEARLRPKVNRSYRSKEFFLKVPMVYLPSGAPSFLQKATSPQLNIRNNLNKSSCFATEGSKTKNIALSSLNSNNLKDTSNKNNLDYPPKMRNTPNQVSLNLSEAKTLLSRDLALIVHSLDSYKILQTDDIDDLNNQRIRTPSDQIQQQVRIGLFRFKKMFLKLISSGSTSQTITDLLNGALREFFGSNPLSQFLDQTNPLAEITHKRRVSKLGIGGIQRESATLKVRTIHSTYFGRICPIETPEGLNAGLVNSLTCLSRVDQKGQLVTPLSLLIEGQKQEQFFYYSSKENSALSTTDTALLKFHRLPKQFIYTKNESQFQQLQPALVKLRVKSDLQTISLATALIPFLAYDDANRALMGSNMQRQAVPLILPERPIVRTGMESLVTNESGHSFQSSFGGFVSYISAQYVVILSDTLNKRLLA